MKENDVTAIVLGGGRGSRLFPLTKSRAKPAVPLAGKYRLIDIPISNCINSGIKKVYVLTQFLTASLHSHVAQTYNFDKFTEGFVEILPAEQTRKHENWYQGTADAVRKSMERIVYHNSRDTLILAGDHVYRMDYARFLDFHREKDADVTVAVLPIKPEETHRFGILKTDNDGKIASFMEKPKEEEMLSGLTSRPGTEKPFLASMGIYIFKTEILESLLDETQGDDFGHNILPDAIRRYNVFGYPFEGYWEDIGTIDCFFRVNLALAKQDPEFSFYDVARPVFTRPRFLPPTVIDNCDLNDTMLAEGCRIRGARLFCCTMGLRSVIEPGVQLRRVVMLGADYYEEDAEKDENIRFGRPHIGVGAGSYIEGAIIDKNARIGNNVRIFSCEGQPDRDEENYYIRNGIVVIPKNAVIPDGTAIGMVKNTENRMSTDCLYYGMLAHSTIECAAGEFQL